MVMAAPENGGTPISLREVYGLIESVRKELLSEMKATEAKLDSVMVRHQTEHTAHDAEHNTHAEWHDREHEKRVSLVRWAITTIIAILAVVIAGYVGIQSLG